jgi:hypothetical protein
MPSSANLVPAFDSVHIVLDNFGTAGRVYRETNEAQASFDTVVEDLLSGQYNSPVRVVAFNTVEGWARDVSEDVAREVVKRAAERGRSLDGLRRFLISYLDERTLAPADE